ncbi:hypothetical protein BC939DRAFT_105154 [Gamsiella multidivaricata]|uniref:uncharacterized protein n=1 Tax=Gamsiella multidivaricata TaxID=101098 RepID=UPI0022209D07|nr:uncharacterized protein BC939DRAFT_105154 [Gamsiella multidivaricata]KAI7832491.1 hypothetical protein BC939DRAFT_105154 [Gamsiella multidivaricata]
MKVRTRKIQHDLPESMTQYQWKPWKTTPMAPSAPVIPPQNTTQPEPATAKKVKSVDEMNKADFTRALDWEHPTVTLDVGTLSANVRRAEDLSPDEASEVLRCLREAIRLAADTKRTCQQLLGRFIERVSDPAIFKETDRDLLDLICPRIPGTNKDNDGDKDSDKDDDKDGDKDGEEQEDIDSEIDKEQEDRDADSEVDKDDHQRFLGILTTYVYSGIIPSGKTKSIQCTRRFIDRAQELHLLERKDAAIINTRMPYPGSVILRSIIAQLSVDLKRLYGKGCKELHKKVNVRRKE